jgi:hypothetical protein
MACTSSVSQASRSGVVRESLTQGTAPRRGWTVLVLALALASAGVGALFGVLNHFQPAGSVAFWFNLVIPMAFSVPGAVLVGYRPANPIGWILATLGVTSGVSLLLAEYGQYAIRTSPGSVPGGVLALWLAAVFGLPTLGLVPLLFLLFPDGSLPSPRWRPVAWVAVAAMAGFIVAGAFSPGPIGGDPLPGSPQNPVGTVLLGLGYAAAVLIGGQLAGQERSNLVVAGSTLAVATVSQPARRRVQAGVDRRFNRRRYDAAKTIEAFRWPTARGDRPGHAVRRAARGGRSDHAAHHGVALAAAISAHRYLNCARGVLAGPLLACTRPSSWAHAATSSHPVPAHPGVSRCVP